MTIASYYFLLVLKSRSYTPVFKITVYTVELKTGMLEHVYNVYL